MMPATTARMLKPVGAGRYLVKEIDAPPTKRYFEALDTLIALEEHHMDGWEVCGVAPADHARAIWVYYRKTNP